MRVIFRTKISTYLPIYVQYAFHRRAQFAFFDGIWSSSLICNPNGPRRKRTRSMPTFESRARSWIILSVHSPFSKVRMDRVVLRVASIFRARWKRQAGGREPRVYECGSRILRYGREETSVASVVRAIRESSRRAHAAAPAHISALLWLHFRLFVVQEGTWQLAVRT